MEFSEAREIVAQGLKHRGFRGRKGTWRLVGDDIQWVVHLDRPPSRNRIIVEIGLDLQTESVRALPTDCPVLLHAENLSVGRGLGIRKAFDLDSGFHAEERLYELEQLTKALADYLHQRSSLPEVRRAYRTGEFASGFIRRDIRPVLEEKDPTV